MARNEMRTFAQSGTPGALLPDSRRRCATVLAAILFGVALPAGNAATVSNVLHITLDGMTASYLYHYVTSNPAVFPNFWRLMAEGAFTFNARCDRDITETVPNHVTILTARPIYQPPGQPETTHHGFDYNGTPAATIHTYSNATVPYKASVLDVAHDHGLTTAIFLGKTKLAVCTNSYNASNGGPDTIGEDNGRKKFDYALVASTTAPLLGMLTNLLATNPPHYTLIHFVDTDTDGHSAGWGSATWSNTVIRMDGYLGHIFRCVGQNPALSNRTALVVVADHGGGGDGAFPSRGHFVPEHPLNYTIPMFVWGGGFAPASDLYAYFSNRADPGTNYSSQGDAIQPLRNGDTPNLALMLLGLPEIPGSYFRPALGVPAVEPPTLLHSVGPGQLQLAWPLDSGCGLECADGLGTGWRAVTNDITSDATHYRFTGEIDPAVPLRLYRLRKP